MRKFEGKTFLIDGIEEVKLFRVIDADSSFFQTAQGTIDLRYYGINAPETTKKIEPFGHEAYQYSYNILTNAYKIVIESDGVVPEKDGTGKRFLAYIWYQETPESDFVLYNAKILEDGFAKLYLFDNVNIYREDLIKAYEIGKNNKKNIHDPSIKYESFDVVSKLSIEEVLKNKAKYADGRTILTKGVITYFVGKSFFICDNGFSTYVYNTKLNVNDLNIGDEIEFHAQFSNDITFGSQFTNIRGVSVLSTSNEIDIVQVETLEEIMKNIGGIVEIKGAKVFQKYSCNKKFNSYCVKIILPFGDCLDVKVFKETIDTPTYASIIQNKFFDFRGGLALYKNSINEDPKPWLLLGNGSKNDVVKVEEEN